ncbi:unnamed protein product [Cutaneotrichosporon oleaginosum]
MGAAHSSPSPLPYRILSRQPVGALEPVLTPPALSLPLPTQPKRDPIPIPHELTALPLFDTFFDLVDAHEAGGIETPTPAPLLRSVHELVQCITSSESSPPETWALAREWRDAVRAAHFAVASQHETEARGRPATPGRRRSRAAQDLEKIAASDKAAVDEKSVLLELRQ